MKKNLYTAGTGFAHIIVIVILFIVVVPIPKVIIPRFGIKITTSIQAFLTEMIGFTVHGVVTPSIIFWASSEARAPALLFIRQLKSSILEKFKKNE